MRGSGLLGKLALAPVLSLGLALPLHANGDGDLSLSFPANPSTGYAWKLDAEASDGVDRVALTDEGFGTPESDLIGAPAPQLFSVRCLESGPVRLVFDYVSPDGSTVGETRVVELSCD
ncbi:protease inhibitor I42 family protein [Sinisalibacter lacisalsi]|uniref:Proteinase inhibitor I42 chagasin domain-containing protein n=1 Tax=Sinisalibacter lacisalsi TaxID=1526570 RepID=A0ABQ1QPL8_9RHOB|nr:protease inhibitor I42 family protein [Sinisalibacter lacisalsi]GGD37413.1 hypothetical protein GCM10011358_21440 [Sinisalibacter lacisalsi]